VLVINLHADECLGSIVSNDDKGTQHWSQMENRNQRTISPSILDFITLRFVYTIDFYT